MATITQTEIKLRPYQQEARQDVLKEWEKGVNSTLLVLPTGTGKTIVFSKIAEDRVRQGGRVLILAHRGELLDQASDKIFKSTGLRTAREQAESSAVGAWERITVGSVQTLMRDSRLEEYDRDHFDTIIVDEAHHTLSDSYRKILDYFDGAKLLGVTATPDRGDRKSLGDVYESIAYDYSLIKAVKDGYLSPMKALTMPVDIDISTVKTSQGDYALGDIGHALDPYLEEIARLIAKHCADRKTLIFLPLIATSQKMTRLLQALGMRAAEVNGESPNREEILQDYAEGRYQVLCNSMLLTEGYDCPTIDCVVPLRPTKIRSLYSQMVGRGTRIAPGKSELLILDFLWHTGTHDLARPSYLLAPSKDVADKMTQHLVETGDAYDLEELLHEAERDVIEEREASVAKRLAELRKKKKRLVDPLQYAYSIRAEDLVDYQPTFAWELQEATESQLSAIEAFGMDPYSITTKGYASIVLDKLMARAKAEMATPKQIRLLERRGFIAVGEWTVTEASSMIGRIASNGWKVPRGINPATYKPGGAYGN